MPPSVSSNTSPCRRTAWAWLGRGRVTARMARRRERIRDSRLVDLWGCGARLVIGAVVVAMVHGRSDEWGVPVGLRGGSRGGGGDGRPAVAALGSVVILVGVVV